MSARDMPSAAPIRASPATLPRMSTRPNSRSMVAKTRSMWLVSVTSPAIGSALRPRPWMLCAAVSIPAALRSSSTRSAPAAASARAMAWPMPWALPVTTARRPLRSNRFVIRGATLACSWHRPQRSGREAVLGLDGEAYLQGDLVVRDLAVLDMAADVHHLEPADVPQGLGSLCDGPVYRLGDALLRRTDQLDDLVNVILHGPLLACEWRQNGRPSQSFAQRTRSGSGRRGRCSKASVDRAGRAD